MTTYGKDTQTCANCGAAVECTVLNSTNSFGSPDLDLRPAEMQRSTMHCWLQQCPECGYIAGDLADSIEGAGDIVGSDAYQDVLKNPDLPELARMFEGFSKLQHADPESSAMALIRAAWVCDDASHLSQAKTYRNQAAELLLPLQPVADDENNTTLAAILVDVLRRAERFHESKELATSLLPYQTVKANEILSSVLVYQCGLCDGRDTHCHTVADSNSAG